MTCSIIHTCSHVLPLLTPRVLTISGNSLMMTIHTLHCLNTPFPSSARGSDEGGGRREEGERRNSRWNQHTEHDTEAYTIHVHAGRRTITTHVQIYMYVKILTHHSQFSRLAIQCPTLIYVMFVWSGLMGGFRSIFFLNSCLASVLCTWFSCTCMNTYMHWIYISKITIANVLR